MIKELAAYLDTLACKYASQTNSLDIEYLDSKTAHSIKIIYNSYDMEFIYIKKERAPIPMSTLSLWIYEKNDSKFALELSQLLHYQHINDLRTTFFPLISTKELMDIAFNSLIKIFTDYKEEILNAINNPDLIVPAYAQDIIKGFKLKPKDLSQFNCDMDVCQKYNGNFEYWAYYMHLLGTKHYLDFLNCDYKKCAKYYRKPTTNIEKLINRHISEHKDDELIDNRYLYYLNAQKRTTSDNAIGLRILRSTILTFIILLIIYLIISLTITSFLTKGAVYHNGDIISTAIISAGLPMVFGGIALRNVYEKLFNPKNYQEAIECDHFINPRWLNIFANICFIVTLSASLLFVAYQNSQVNRFYKDKMLLTNDGFYSYQEHNYTDIKAIYLREGIINPYGDFVQRDSYIIQFTDNTYYDFDGDFENEDFINNILPLLHYQGEITKIHTPKDIK